MGREEEDKLMQELLQQQQLIEALLATQRVLLEQRESLSDELCCKMGQLWNDVSMDSSSKKKKRTFCDDEDIDVGDATVYRSCVAQAEVPHEQVAHTEIVYRSLMDFSEDELGVGLGEDATVGVAAAEHAAECNDEPRGTFRSAGSGQAAESALAESNQAASPDELWSLARRVEILTEIGRRLALANDRLDAEAEKPAEAEAALEGALSLSASLKELQVC